MFNFLNIMMVTLCRCLKELVFDTNFIGYLWSLRRVISRNHQTNDLLFNFKLFIKFYMNNLNITTKKMALLYITYSFALMTTSNEKGWREGQNSILFGFLDTIIYDLVLEIWFVTFAYISTMLLPQLKKIIHIAIFPHVPTCKG